MVQFLHLSTFPTLPQLSFSIQFIIIEIIRFFFLYFNFIEEKKDEPRNAMEKAVFVDNLGGVSLFCFFKTNAKLKGLTNSGSSFWV